MKYIGLICTFVAGAIAYIAGGWLAVLAVIIGELGLAISITINNRY